MLALRCIIISLFILTRLELYDEAAKQLIMLNMSNFPDLYGAVLLEHAAQLFEFAKKRRKMLFYLVLSGQRFLKSGLIQFALENYKRVLPLLRGKGWNCAEDYLLHIVSSNHGFISSISDEKDQIKAIKFAVECAAHLLRKNNYQFQEQ